MYMNDYTAFYERPPFSPPDWVFGPVWTILYIMMAIAAFRIILKINRPGAKFALALFAVQLVLNFMWPLIFFTWRNIPLAAAEITVLLIFIVLTGLAFRKVDVTAFLLLIPYFLWVSFATFLTYNIWLINR